MASGDTLVIFTPLHNEPTATVYATLDLTNLHPVLDFDATVNEYAVFSAIMPRNYAATTGVTVYIFYAMSSADADTIDWDAAFEAIGEGSDLTSDSFAAVQSVDNTTVPGMGPGQIDIVSIAFTDGAQMDNLDAGEGFRLKINRDAVNDDAAGDAELVFVEIKET